MANPNDDRPTNQEVIGELLANIGRVIQTRYPNTTIDVAPWRTMPAIAHVREEFEQILRLWIGDSTCHCADCEHNRKQVTKLVRLGYEEGYRDRAKGIIWPELEN